MTSAPVIRPYRPGDLDDLYRICLQTGDNGEDASAHFQDPMLLGHLHVAPYAMLEPSLAFVAEDDIGVGGYVVGALDSVAFDKRLERDWWPRLRERYPEPSAAIPHEQWNRDQMAAYQIHHFPRPDELAGRYPSHLHINLLPRMRAHGLGRKLMATLIDALRECGSPGVHLRVRPRNVRAVEFYRHIGLTQVASSYPPGEWLAFGMDLRARDERIVTS